MLKPFWEWEAAQILQWQMNICISLLQISRHLEQQCDGQSRGCDRASGSGLKWPKPGTKTILSWRPESESRWDRWPLIQQWWEKHVKQSVWPAHWTTLTAVSEEISVKYSSPSADGRPFLVVHRLPEVKEEGIPYLMPGVPITCRVDNTEKYTTRSKVHLIFSIFLYSKKKLLFCSFVVAERILVFTIGMQNMQKNYIYCILSAITFTDFSGNCPFCI